MRVRIFLGSWMVMALAAKSLTGCSAEPSPGRGPEALGRLAAELEAAPDAEMARRILLRSDFAGEAEYREALDALMEQPDSATQFLAAYEQTKLHIVRP